MSHNFKNNLIALFSNTLLRNYKNMSEVKQNF